MAPRHCREPIFELAKKFQFLQENAVSRRKCGHDDNASSFCKMLAIPRNTILGSLEKDPLSAEHQQILARKCGFSPDWPEWKDLHAVRNDKGDGRRDTYEAFKKKYLEHQGKEEPKCSPPPASPVLLKEDWSAETERVQTQLASLALRFGQSRPMPGEAMLKFDLNCPEIGAEDFSTGVQARLFDIPLRTRPDHGSEGSDRLSSGVEFNGAKFTPYSMDKKEPSWLVTASSAGAIGIVGDVTETFIRIMNLTPGGSVSADFTACVRDIATTFALSDGQNQSVAKQKIKKRLREMKLSGGEDGIAKLAAAASPSYNPAGVRNWSFRVTIHEWETARAAGAVKPKPSGEGWRGSHPVTFISWNEAQSYVAWLAVKTGKPYRLLSEAEWEYAGRAGTETAYSFGKSISKAQAQFEEELQGSTPSTVEVGSFAANNFGLYDMHGNVWEWCEDCWNQSYADKPESLVQTGGAWTTRDGRYRVLRGGSWAKVPQFLRSACRGRNYTGDRYDNIGFRVARTILTS